jgi:hypothetical protein
MSHWLVHEATSHVVSSLRVSDKNVAELVAAANDKLKHAWVSSTLDCFFG